MPWWKSAVVYQIYPRSFSDSDGDGVGDVRGIIQRLDHLSALGVDVIWLSPIFRSPQDDNGYDISDYTDVDPLFGTLQDVDELIGALHERGMKLIMDLVVNHTSDEHPWFVESRDPASAKRDWYVWRPPRDGIAPGAPGAEPTNWGSYFMGPAWEFDPARGEYFLHLFSRKQPDLNWENPEVRQAVYSMMNWWVQRGVDGFRMDVINLISKTLPLADGEPTPGMGGLCYDPALVTNGPRLEEFLKEMNAAVGISARELFTVGEMLMVDVDQARRYTARDADELGMVFTFEHMNLDQQPGLSKFLLAPLHLPALKANLAQWQYGLAEDGWNSLYWNNHDQPRVVSRFGDDSEEHRVTSAKTLGTVLHMLRGTPYVYQGEELGMTNAGYTAIGQYADIESVNFYGLATTSGLAADDVLAGLAVKSRDNARTPVQWDAGPNAGFTTGRPWLPVNGNHVTINAVAARDDADSVFHHYRRLIALRHELEIVREGRFDLLLPDHEQVFAYTRTLADQVLVVTANLSGQPVRIDPADLPDLATAKVLLATHADPAPGTLRPWESTIYLG
ncbi:MAG TPA: alpha-glucosidase [Micropruina sp.]|nr:alpha-glucosidase [Micropruina sp.]